MYCEEEQLSLFGSDSTCGRMSREPSRRTEDATPKPSSRSLSASQTMTLHPFLCLTRANGESGGGTWEPDQTVGGLLPIGYMTLNSGVYHSDDVESAFSVITADGQPTGYCLTLNTGEKPRMPIPSKLSEILERNPDHKYDLSAKACQGILNRAERRGKELPPELKAALELQAHARDEAKKIPAMQEQYRTMQSACKETVSTEQTPQDATAEAGGGGAATPSTLSTDQPSGTDSDNQHISDVVSTAYSFDSVASNSMKSSNPNSGCREVETAKTLDCFDPNPSKNQGGIAVVSTYDVRITSDGTQNARAHCYETDISRCLDTGGENPDSNHGGGGGDSAPASGHKLW